MGLVVLKHLAVGQKDVVILAQIRKRSNYDGTLRRVDTDEWGVKSCVAFQPTRAKVSVSGNRISVTAERKCNSTSFAFRQREQVQKFSRSSGYRMAKHFRECVADYSRLGTLTFDDCPSGKDAKLCLSRFFKRVRRAFANNSGFSLCWFLEFQGRGSIHIHFFSSVYIHKDWLSANWLASQGDSGRKICHTNIVSIRSGRYGMQKYALKYAQKQSQKVLPPDFGWVGRFWGIIGNRDVAAATVDIGFEQMNDPVKAAKVHKVTDFVEKGVSEGWIRYREIQKTDDDTGEKVNIGVSVWDILRGYKMREFIRLVNDLIDDPEKRLKHQRGWICDRKANSNTT